MRELSERHSSHGRQNRPHKKSASFQLNLGEFLRVKKLNLGLASENMTEAM